MKTYRVVGKRKVRGHSKGHTFQADMSPQQEAHLIEAGHIVVVVPQQPEEAEEN